MVKLKNHGNLIKKKSFLVVVVALLNLNWRHSIDSFVRRHIAANFPRKTSISNHVDSVWRLWLSWFLSAAVRDVNISRNLEIQHFIVLELAVLGSRTVCSEWPKPRPEETFQHQIQLLVREKEEEERERESLGIVENSRPLSSRFGILDYISIFDVSFFYDASKIRNFFFILFNV